MMSAWWMDHVFVTALWNEHRMSWLECDVPREQGDVQPPQAGGRQELCRWAGPDGAHLTAAPAAEQMSNRRVCLSLGFVFFQALAL